MHDCPGAWATADRTENSWQIAGDVRHCFADITRARELLNFEPRVELEEGIESMAEWLERQIVEDRGLIASQELVMRGLMV